MHLLIPYVHLPGHNDPLFEEFTYGDGGARGRKLKALQRGDYIFFHTTIRGVKCVTAYYVIDRVLPTKAAYADRRIRAKYGNPHIRNFDRYGFNRDPDQTVAFGDPVLSNVLKRPVVLDKRLASRLSLGIRFPEGRSEAQAIGSATRAWRELSARDVQLLLAAAVRAERDAAAPTPLRSSEEVGDIVEKDVEEHIARHPRVLGPGFRLLERQVSVASGRIDLLFEKPPDELLVVEVKAGRIGRQALRQLRGYVRDVQAAERRTVRGALVCEGVMPAFEEDVRKSRDIQVFIYGWHMTVRRW